MDSPTTPTDATATTIEEVAALLVETLGIEDRAGDLHADTELLGSMPEFDSLAVVQILTAVEERFGVEVDDSDVDAEVFETLGSLAAFVAAQRG